MAWEKQNENAKEKDADAASVTLSEFQNKIKSISRPNIPIKAVAVWDTVGELGIPIDGVSNAYSFVNTKVSPNIEYAFQALALEEHRKPFRPTVWEQPDGQELPRVLKQCWFTGYHSLVGGGNTDNNEIPNIALAWMIAQLKDLLEFDILLIKANNDMRQVAARHDLQGEASPRECEDSYITCARARLTLHSSHLGLIQRLLPFSRLPDSDTWAVSFREPKYHERNG